MTDELLAAVDDARFSELFIRKLGWNSPTHGALRVDDGFGNTFEVNQVASYRGMGIWSCGSIPSLDSQRLIDSEVARKTLERLIIYTDGERQEWRWPRSTRRGKPGRPTLVPHRHTVGQPNPSLAERLRLIEIPADGQMTVPELLDLMREAFDREAETASKQAARLMGSLYEKLESAGMGEQESSIFLARMLFLMFGDDTGMWKKSLFHDFLAESTKADGSDLRQRLAEAFEAADTAVNLRRSELPKALGALPYINGGIFAEELRMPELDGAFRKALIEACRFDWGQISPAVFGSMFQTVKSKEARRHLGEHYTSEENILRTIEPLFLDELRERLEAAWDDRKALAKLHRDLGEMRFLDPACGCGNFLIVAYRELRALELALLIRQRDLAAQAGDRKAMQLAIDATQSLKVSIEQFYGIEIEAWPARIAETAMFLVDHQANLRMDHELGTAPTRLPLEVSPHILNANALTTDWGSLVPADESTYVFGNPPFLGSLMLSEEQKAAARYVWGDFKRLGTMDLVTNWFVLGARLAHRTGCQVAFVSTNSISQGEQVAALWDELGKSEVHISFAHQTFKWTNEAVGQAAVHVVIIGMSPKRPGVARLFTYPDPTGSPVELEVVAINPYLAPGDMVIVGTRLSPLNPGQTQMRFGSMPRDGGWLSKISPEEASGIRGTDPIAAKYLRRLVGADELINGTERWCLWLVDAEEADLGNSPELRRRLEKVREMRAQSKATSTRKWADRPGQFVQQAQPSTTYLAVPGVSSENRKYVPMAIYGPDVIASNALLTVSDAGLLAFGLLQSRAFSVWNATVSGRLGLSVRISAEITYHNFPYPPRLQEFQEAIEAGAQCVLDARMAHPDMSLAKLYDPALTPVDLLEAHRGLDAAVLAAYELEEDASESVILASLFARYSNLVRDLDPPHKGASVPRTSRRS